VTSRLGLGTEGLVHVRGLVIAGQGAGGCGSWIDGARIWRPPPVSRSVGSIVSEQRAVGRSVSQSVSRRNDRQYTRSPGCVGLQTALSDVRPNAATDRRATCVARHDPHSPDSCAVNNLQNATAARCCCCCCRCSCPECFSLCIVENSAHAAHAQWQTRRTVHVCAPETRSVNYSRATSSPSAATSTSSEMR